MVEAIICDLGNVLVGFDHRIAVKKILKHTDKTVDDIYSLFFDSEFTQSFERGNISEKVFFEKVKSALDLRIDYGRFLPIWNDIFFAMKDSEKLIGSIDRKTRKVLLSNINQLHYEHVKNKFSSALGLFDEILPSYVTGFIKPQRQIYELAIRLTGKQPESIIYIDDRQDLVDAASAYGINSIRFIGARQLKEDLQALGLNIR